jgi:hypothetical protein
MDCTITAKGWKRLFWLSGILDAAQIGIDFIPGVGEAANEIIDLPIGILLTLYFWWKKAISLKTFFAALVAFFGEEATAAALPLWLGDVWYTHRTVMQAGGGAAAEITAALEQGALNQAGSRTPVGRSQPLNRGGSRQPM